MPKNTNKTQATVLSVEDYIATFESDVQADCRTLVQLMSRLTGCPPVMWGPAIIGFDTYHYKYESGREGDFMRIGFSPRKGQLSLYLLPDVNQHGEILSRLGKHKLGKACLYLKKLSDAQPAVLEELMQASLAKMEELYPQR